MTVVRIQNAHHRLVGLSTLFPDGGVEKDSCGTVRRCSLTGENGSLVVWESWDFIAQLHFLFSVSFLSADVMWPSAFCCCLHAFSPAWWNASPQSKHQHNSFQLLLDQNFVTATGKVSYIWFMSCGLIHRADTMELGLWLQRIHLPRRNTRCLNSVSISQHMLNVWANKCSPNLSYRAKDCLKTNKSLKIHTISVAGDN